MLLGKQSMSTDQAWSPGPWVGWCPRVGMRRVGWPLGTGLPAFCLSTPPYPPRYGKRDRGEMLDILEWSSPHVAAPR